MYISSSSCATPRALLFDNLKKKKKAFTDLETQCFIIHQAHKPTLHSIAIITKRDSDFSQPLSQKAVPAV